MATVLVVEDDRDYRDLLQILLERMGHQVLGALSAVEALQIMAERGIPDIAVLDVVMPNISGLELLEHMRRERAYTQMSAVIISARDHTVDIEQAHTLGAVYLHKPLKAADLRHAIDQALEQHQSDGPAEVSRRYS